MSIHYIGAVRLVAACAVALAFAGCSSQGSIVRTSAGASVGVLTYGGTGAAVGSSAELIGLVTQSNSCITVLRDDGSPFTPIFPESAIHQLDDQSLVGFKYNGSDYVLGSKIVLTGGVVVDAAAVKSGCPGPFFSVRLPV